MCVYVSVDIYIFLIFYTSVTFWYYTNLSLLLIQPVGCHMLIKNIIITMIINNWKLRTWIECSAIVCRTASRFATTRACRTWWNRNAERTRWCGSRTSFGSFAASRRSVLTSSTFRRPTTPTSTWPTATFSQVSNVSLSVGRSVGRDGRVGSSVGQSVGRLIRQSDDRPVPSLYVALCWFEQTRLSKRGYMIVALGTRLGPSHYHQTRCINRDDCTPC